MRQELNFNYWGSKENLTHPDQTRSNFLHHLRVDHVATALVNADVSYVSQPDNLFVDLLHLGAMTHDLGKKSVPYFIHKATKHPAAGKHYERLYDYHPTVAINRLGGKSFVDKDPLLANLIFFHHPDIPQPNIHGLSWKNRIQHPGFNWALTYLIVADGIVAGNELFRFYNDGKNSSQEHSKAIFWTKLYYAGLNEIINVPKAVTVGYEAFKQLNF